MPLSDEPPAGNEAIGHILFDGMLNMEFVISHSGLKSEGFYFVRVVQKNVYIFGQNRAGKFTRGNIMKALNGGPKFKVGGAVQTTSMPSHHDAGPYDAFRLWELTNVGDTSDYATPMKRHIIDTINNIRRYSATTFIFNSKIQPIEIVEEILKFAEDIFGTSVQKSLLAIVNKFYKHTEEKLNLTPSSSMSISLKLRENPSTY